jgi:catechol 2,3-dioxygenase-like lactoylglutathione lyase family enzyme
MLTTSKLMAFVATRDGVRARAFYEGTLGLKVLSDDDFALALDAGGTTLRVQKVGDLSPHPFTALGWEVDDIDATIDALRTRGIVFQRFPGLDQDDRGVWISPSSDARIAWFRDPDGNTLSLTQM